MNNLFCDANNQLLKKLNPQREFKLKLIQSLSDIGLDTKKISNFLNSNNYKIFSGLEWTPKLVLFEQTKIFKKIEKIKRL